MNSTSIKIDDNTKALFDALSPEEINKAINAVLNAQAKVLKSETQSLLKSRMPNSTHPNWWNMKPMFEGVRARRAEYDEVKVHIMGDFRLKFFEKGTNPRMTKGGDKRKKPHSTGQIVPKNFFADAQTACEQQMYEAGQNALNKTLKKFNA